MDGKWRKNELPKSKKYCTWLRNFNENFTKMLRIDHLFHKYGLV
ncbi:hypothetical protein T10_2358 [Trichinella papuae]|uniref:Uncharacterized protein n=1 Tax=Trichinella papuae TaxID=268474 RepID=A0A0V1LYS4_9BILA|nr:hypothetical protein T10_2358 [Trichinella papuae]